MIIENKFIPPHALNTAVLFLVFNRMKTTKQVFAEIKKVKPPRLYIASDGARKTKKGEFKEVKAVREFILSKIDWDCEIKTLFRKKNLGCKHAISSAITWFFDNEEMGIILEDDCLPSQSFFWYCEELLDRYKEDNRIFLISGYNKQNTWRADRDDYFFSNFGGIWGWATWRRAWNHYDINMSDINMFMTGNKFEHLLGKEIGKKRMNGIYNSIIKKNMDTWDYQWGYARHKNSAMACVPSKSLIKNIGFGDGATHTTGDNLENVDRHNLNIPLKNNNFIVCDKEYDKLFLTVPLPAKIKRVIRKVIQMIKSKD